jgi:hypothetical protein
MMVALHCGMLCGDSVRCMCEGLFCIVLQNIWHDTALG